MARIVYIDTLFFLNLIVNYLLLLATAKIAAVPASRVRIALGALFGALYAVAAFLPMFGFFFQPIMRIVSGVAMVLIVFGKQRGLLRHALMFFAVSAAFGGVIYAVSLMAGTHPVSGVSVVLPISFQVLIVSFALCYGVLSLVFQRLGRNMGDRLHRVEITHRGKTVTTTGLYDTGNSLTDPIYNRGVLIVERSILAPLFHQNTLACLNQLGATDPVDLLEPVHHTPDGVGMYLVPYTTISTKSAFLLAFRPDCVKINGKEKRGVSVAISANRVSDGGRYAALLNGEMV